MKEFDENMLRQRIAQDEKFHGAEMEKARKKHAEAKDLQEYLKTQAVCYNISGEITAFTCYCSC